MHARHRHGGDRLNILVVDSDRDMVEMVTSWLRSRGYTVHFSFSADKARSVWLERKPDLVIAEVKLAGVDVMAICRELRVQHDALVLAVTDEPSPTIEAHCLESGADAFLAKPFLPKLLLAHLHALSRRVRATLQRQPSSVFEIGPIRFDASRNEVRVNGRVEHLTPTESRILQILAINVGDVCTQGQIVSHAWGYGEDGDTYLIKAHIRHLREKIEPVPSKPRFIRTVPGVGYTLSVSAASGPSDGASGFASEDVDGHSPDESDDSDGSDDISHRFGGAQRIAPVASIS
jgi:DNA-binding response OmpR family regulator